MFFKDKNGKTIKVFTFVIITTVTALFLTAFVVMNQTGFYSLPTINNLDESRQSNDNQTKPTSDALLDINSATEEDFAEFSKISKRLSKSIVNFREKIGGFKSVDELLKVPNMTDEIYDAVNFFMTVK